MRTISGTDSGTYLMPKIESARTRIWVCSPWIGEEYAKKLVQLNNGNVEVRIITSNVDYNLPILSIFKSITNRNFYYTILEQNPDDKSRVFVHSKIYIVDDSFAITGSANLTFSGMNKNVETINLHENYEEVQKIEREFMKLWMDLEHKKTDISNVGLDVVNIKNSFPISFYPKDFSNKINGKIKKIELILKPYSYCEYSYHGTIPNAKSNFDGKGNLVLSGENKIVFSDNNISDLFMNYEKKDIIYKKNSQESDWVFTIKESKISNSREAWALFVDYIVDKNSFTYFKTYRSGSYPRKFVPRKGDVNIIKIDYSIVPTWIVDYYNDLATYQSIILGTNGKIISTQVYCPDCGQKYLDSSLIACDICGKKVCPRCLTEKGLIFKKKICRTCSH